MMDESSQKLKSEDYAGSLKISEKVIREMIERLGPGEAATLAFGIVVSHKALALEPVEAIFNMTINFKQ